MLGMGSFNKVILMGNLTRDPELRYTPSGTAVCNVGLAVNRRYQDQAGEWKDEPTFIDVTIWGKRGEAFSKFHQKGRPAFLEGSLRLDTWEDKQSGAKRSKLYVVADSWEFCGSGKEGGGSGGGGGEGGSWAGDSGGGGGSRSEFAEAVDDTPF